MLDAIRYFYEKQKEAIVLDFSFSQTQEMIRKTVREFAEKEVAPKAAECDEKGEFPWDNVKKMAKLGLFGILTPPEYGGTGLGHVTFAMVLEELAQACAPTAHILANQQVPAYSILLYGTEEQKRKYLVPLARGEKLGGIAMTEAGGGSDPLSMASRAKLVGNEYVIKGRKCMVTGGQVADIFVVYARTGEGSKGISAFILEKNTPGFKVGGKEKKTGTRAFDLSTLIFNDAKVPKENLIGKEGDGLRVGLRSINDAGKFSLAALALGVARSAFEDAAKFCNERVLYGKPIVQLQAIQFALADMKIQIEAARWLIYHAAWLIDKGENARTEVAGAKLFAVETALQVASKALSILGGYGVISEFNVERHLRDATSFIAAGGTQEINRLIVGRSLLTSKR